MSLFIWCRAAKDPNHKCEVCLKVMTDIHADVKQLPNPKDKVAIESLIDKYCSKKNKKAGPRERKLCYYISADQTHDLNTDVFWRATRGDM